MPLYLSRFSYKPETWARLIGHPEDRRKAAQTYIESVGGKLHGFWYAFGTHDGYNLWEAPDTQTQYLYTSDDEPGRIYKLTLDGKILGTLGKSGHEVKQFNWIHALACPTENDIYVADMNNWRVQKLTLHPERRDTANR